MSKAKPKRNKPYVPKPVRLFPSVYRLERGAEVSLKLIPHEHLQNMLDGTGSENMFLTLALRLFTGRGMAEMLISEDNGQATLVLNHALTALHSVGQRYERLKQFGFNGDELLDIKEGLNLVDALQDVTLRREQRANYSKWGDMVCSFDRTMENLSNYARLG